MSKHNMSTQGQRDHHANQCNPDSKEYKAAMDNHANQCNPNHGAGGHRDGGKDR